MIPWQRDPSHWVSVTLWQISAYAIYTITRGARLCLHCTGYHHSLNRDFLLKFGWTSSERGQTSIMIMTSDGRESSSTDSHNYLRFQNDRYSKCKIVEANWLILSWIIVYISKCISQKNLIGEFRCAWFKILLITLRSSELIFNPGETFAPPQATTTMEVSFLFFF